MTVIYTDFCHLLAWRISTEHTEGCFSVCLKGAWKAGKGFSSDCFLLERIHPDVLRLLYSA